MHVLAACFSVVFCAQRSCGLSVWLSVASSLWRAYLVHSPGEVFYFVGFDTSVVYGDLGGVDILRKSNTED